MGKPYVDPAIKNKKKVMFLPQVDGNYDAKLASMVIDSSHARPVSLNWDFGSDEQNNLIVRVVLLSSDGNWMFQTSTSGWRGFWVADSLIKGQKYTMMFHWDRSVKVDFIWNGKKK